MSTSKILSESMDQTTGAPSWDSSGNLTAQGKVTGTGLKAISQSGGG